MNDPHFTKTLAFPGLLHPRGAGEEMPPRRVGELVNAVRRQGFGLGLWVLFCLGAALAYLATTPPQFVASTLILLQPARPPVGAVVADGGIYQNSLDAALADSQMQIVKSERLLRFVFDTLKLAAKPEFAPPPPGMRQRIQAWFGPVVPPTTQQLADTAFLSFMGRVGVRRIGISYVLEITYTASTPALAASMVNSVTSAYILDEVGAARRGSEYTQDRINALNTQESAALQAVQTGTISEIRFPDSDARVISAAVAPQARAFPQSGLVCAFALCAGLITGLGTILVRHSVDDRIRNRRHLPPAVLTMAVLPALSRRERRLWLPRSVPAPHGYSGAYFDALRSAMPPVLNVNAEGRRHVFGITSWRPGEGKSTVALSLAGLLAAAGEDVVLVDAQMRGHVLTDTIAPPATVGLSEALSRRSPASYPDRLRLTDRMQFVPAVSGGAADRDLFLGSVEMRALLADLSRHGTVIVDLPALTASSDALAIGPLLDGLVVVVEAHVTTSAQLHDAFALIRAADCNVHGVILNKATR